MRVRSIKRHLPASKLLILLYSAASDGEIALNRSRSIITARKRRLSFYTCHSVHGRGLCLPQCMLGYTPPSRADTPQEKSRPPRADTPTSPREQRLPLEQTPPSRSRHPLGADTLLRSACWEIRATRGRYVSHWNAYLF